MGDACAPIRLAFLGGLRLEASLGVAIFVRGVMTT